MPFTTAEALALSQEAADLGASSVAALRTDSDGGKKFTRAERRAIGKDALALAAQLLLDVVD